MLPELKTILNENSRKKKHFKCKMNKPVFKPFEI